MQLIGQYDSPFVRRVAISLHTLSIPFGRNPLSVFRNAEAMRRINPLGRVPALVLDDGEVLIDSAAILDHLDELAGPAKALVPPRGAERRAALRIIALAAGAIDKAVAIGYERLLRPVDKVHPPWIDRCRQQIDSALAALDVMRPDPWLTGKRLMQADITTAAMLGYVRFRVPEALPAGRFPNLDALARMASRLPAFTATLPTAEEIGGPAAEAEAGVRRFRGLD